MTWVYCDRSVFEMGVQRMFYTRTTLNAPRSGPEISYADSRIRKFRKITFISSSSSREGAEPRTVSLTSAFCFGGKVSCRWFFFWTFSFICESTSAMVTSPPTITEVCDTLDPVDFIVLDVLRPRLERRRHFLAAFDCSCLFFWVKRAVASVLVSLARPEDCRFWGIRKHKIYFTKPGKISNNVPRRRNRFTIATVGAYHFRCFFLYGILWSSEDICLRWQFRSGERE